MLRRWPVVRWLERPPSGGWYSARRLAVDTDAPTIKTTAGVWLCLVLLLLSAAPAHRANAQDPIAVIVHPKSAIADISLGALQRVYLGRTATLQNKEPVLLVESAWLRERFYSRALSMNADRFKRHWIGVIFSGEGASPPKEMGSPAEVLQYVASHPSAIAFIELSIVDKSVKTVTIDGLRPTEPAYRLRDRP